jgi:C4-dicarboxylate transporter DctQ subunit
MTTESRLWRAVDEHLESAIACIFLATVAVCIILQVILRYGFNVALTWTEEIAGYAMVGAVYMGASLAVRERFHIRIMAGVLLFPRFISLPIIILSDLIFLGFNIFMLWVIYDYLGVLWLYPSISTALAIDEFWPNLILPLGFVLMSYRLIQIYYRWRNDNYDGLPGVGAEYDDMIKGMRS